MIPLLFGLLQAATPTPAPKPTAPPSAAASKFEACTALAKTDPAKASAQAEAWRVAGGGLPARECLGVALAAQERWAPAAIAFQQAATDAEIQRDGRAASLWVQAGNAALAGDDAGTARRSFDRALKLPVLSDAMRGEAHLDRARALVDLNDMSGARSDIDQSLKLVPADPLAWLLSATLARRQKDGARAATDIAQAAKLAPDDPAVIFETGNIAELRGDRTAAQAAWARAAEKDPEGPAGKAAMAALTPRLDKQGEDQPKSAPSPAATPSTNR
jgi:tetratricopeptide (TPR) repeat protein